MHPASTLHSPALKHQIVYCRDHLESNAFAFLILSILVHVSPGTWLQGNMGNGTMRSAAQASFL